MYLSVAGCFLSYACKDTTWERQLLFSASLFSRADWGQICIIIISQSLQLLGKINMGHQEHLLQPLWPPSGESIVVVAGLDKWKEENHSSRILLFVTVWIDLENIMLSEISQSEKEKCCMIALICGT